MNVRLCSLLSASLTAASLLAADVREGLVSYWPLDTVSADLSTPDTATGNHMFLNAMDGSSLIAGQRGQALTFNGLDQYAWYTALPDTDTGLPISRAPQFSVLFWVKGLGTGQSDRRMFSESSLSNADPLFNLGTQFQGTTNTVDIYIRDAGVRVNHAQSTNAPLDDQWRTAAFYLIAQGP